MNFCLCHIHVYANNAYLIPEIQSLLVIFLLSHQMEAIHHLTPSLFQYLLRLTEMREMNSGQK